MLEGLMGEISSTIKGILTKLNLCDTKLDEIGTKQDSTSTALTTVGTKIDGVQTTSDAIKTMISSEVKTAITNAKKEIIAAMPSGGGMSSCIRHIQRGIGSIADDETTATIKLSGFLDLSKMVVIIDGFRSPDSTSYVYYMGAPYLKELSTTSLTVICRGERISATNYAYFSYQVIEFY